MITKKTLTIFLLITFSAYFLTAKPVNSQTANSSQPTQNTIVEIFADREVINKGEDINLKVLLTSKQMKSATITVFYADKYLKPVELMPLQKGIVQQTLDLSQTSLGDFTFTGVNTGKYNLYIEVIGTDKKNQKIPPTRQQIKGLEIKKSESLWWKLLSNSLVGVFLGAILTFLVTLINDYREQRKEKAKRQQLIVSNLLAHLNANLLAVRDREKTRFEEWINLFLKEGYYTEIQNLSGKTDRDLANKLLQVGFDLHKYEQERLAVDFTEDKKKELEKQLPNLIAKLKSIAENLE